jgi:hypothetical protein
MKKTHTSTLVLALGVLFGGHAMADQATGPVVGKTREQVRAELMEYKAAHRNDVFLPFSNTLISDFVKDMDAIKSHRDVPATANAEKMQSKTDAVKS